MIEVNDPESSAVSFLIMKQALENGKWKSDVKSITDPASCVAHLQELLSLEGGGGR